MTYYYVEMVYLGNHSLIYRHHFVFVAMVLLQDLHLCCDLMRFGSLMSRWMIYNISSTFDVKTTMNSTHLGIAIPKTVKQWYPQSIVVVEHHEIPKGISSRMHYDSRSHLPEDVELCRCCCYETNLCPMNLMLLMKIDDDENVIVDEDDAGVSCRFCRCFRDCRVFHHHIAVIMMWGSSYADARINLANVMMMCVLLQPLQTECHHLVCCASVMASDYAACEPCITSVCLCMSTRVYVYPVSQLMEKKFYQRINTLSRIMIVLARIQPWSTESYTQCWTGFQREPVPLVPSNIDTAYRTNNWLKFSWLSPYEHGTSDSYSINWLQAVQARVSNPTQTQTHTHTQFHTHDSPQEWGYCRLTIWH